ncbi:MAG: hypothetical protein WKF92_10590 [Pyrinomonadaceae bacterium]
MALYIKRADLYFRLDDSESVLRDINKAISIGPKEDNLLESASRILVSAGLCGEGVKLADQMLSADKKNHAAYRISYRCKFALQLTPEQSKTFSKATMSFPPLLTEPGIRRSI